MTGHVPTERAEDAIRLIFYTLGSHRSYVARMPKPRIRGRLAPKKQDTVQIQRQATLLRLVSITESFCAGRLIARAEESIGAPGSQVMTHVWERASLDATGTWEAQKDAYRKWLGVKPDWQVLDGLAEARNAVAHGLGALTRRQVKSHASTMTKINRTGIAVIDDVLILSDNDLLSAARACRDLISEVDSQTASFP